MWRVNDINSIINVFDIVRAKYADSLPLWSKQIFTRFYY